MHNIMRFIRQNRKKIIRYAIIAAFLFLILQILNYMTKNSKEVSSNIEVSNIYDRTNGTVKSEKSMVSGEKISNETINKANNTVKTFVEYCNDGKVEEAYELLTDDCKNVLYSNVEDFKNNYYNKLFENQKVTYTIENWVDDIFVVRYTNDILSTGKSLENATYQDYITVINKDGESKININKFIGRREINKIEEHDNIKVEVLYKDIFMDYETYEMKITNSTRKTILMDRLVETDSIYLKDMNKNKHKAISNELIDDDLLIYKRSYKCCENKI